MVVAIKPGIQPRFLWQDGPASATHAYWLRIGEKAVGGWDVTLSGHESGFDTGGFLRGEKIIRCSGVNSPGSDDRGLSRTKVSKVRIAQGTYVVFDMNLCFKLS